ncbi:MAG: hypothetical protein KGL53_14880 [Elusimicrobia bacterium]|nr:hypothetical protein [Elusimicrobiota bacterium]
MRLLALALALSAAAPAAAASASPAVAKLDGRVVVTEADLSDWSAAQACYGPGALTSRKAAFMRLTEAAVAEAAMAAHGGPVIDAAKLDAEVRRIDRETRAPEILACIKRSLGERYARVFVRPELVESSLRLFLMRDPKVQEGPRGKAEEALARARKGGSLEKAATALGLFYSSATYTTAPSTTPASFRPDMPPPDYQAAFIKGHLAALEPGEAAAAPIESDYAFQDVRLLSHDGPRWTFEAAVARKASQEDWFGSMKKMRLQVLDKALYEWVKGLSGNPRLRAVRLEP